MASPLPRRHTHAQADADASYRQADSGTWHRTRGDTPRDNGGHGDATVSVPWPRPIIATGKPTGLPHASANRGNPHRWRFRVFSNDPGGARCASFTRVGASHRRPMLEQRGGNCPRFLTVPRRRAHVRFTQQESKASGRRHWSVAGTRHDLGRHYIEHVANVDQSGQSWIRRIGGVFETGGFTRLDVLQLVR